MQSIKKNVENPIVNLSSLKYYFFLKIKEKENLFLYEITGCKSYSEI